METIGIQTTQNVFIRHHLASVGERMLAFLIDYAFIISYVIAYFLIARKLMFNSQVLLYIMIIPVIGYHFLCELFFHGQSFGKMIMKLKVIKLDGSQPSIGSYFLRWIFSLVEISLFSGVIAMIVILINGKGQRLGDLAAGTSVIKLNQRIRLEDTIYKEIPDDYVLQFENASKLNDKDMAIITEILNNARRKKSLKSRLLIFETKKAVEKKINNGNEIDMKPHHFLHTIQKDYNYLHNAKKV